MRNLAELELPSNPLGAFEPDPLGNMRLHGGGGGGKSPDPPPPPAPTPPPAPEKAPTREVELKQKREQSGGVGTGPKSTLLTGPGGVNANDLEVGTPTLLGG